MINLACQLVKVPFLFVSQQKATVVFDVALAVKHLELTSTLAEFRR